MDPSLVFPVGCSSGYVTGLPIDTARCVVVEVDLRQNNLTGRLNVTPSNMHLLHWVQVLRLDDNHISGSLPVALVSSLPWLHTLGLSGNRFTYEATPEEVLTRCSPPIASSSTPATPLMLLPPALPPPPAPAFPPTPPRLPLQCIGLPDESCDAFGYDYRVDATVARSCLRCQGSGPALITLFVLPTACLLFVAWYAVRILRNVSAIRTWVPAFSILLLHLSTLSILLRLEFEWPSSVLALMSVMSLDPSQNEWARTECLSAGASTLSAASFRYNYKLYLRLVLPMLLLVGVMLLRFVLDDGVKRSKLWWASFVKRVRAVCCCVPLAASCCR